MVGPQRRNELPYQTMVPTLSEKYEDYEPLRDRVPCFPYELRRPISTETEAGKQNANRALRALKITIDLKDMQFLNLWRGFARGMKLAKMMTHEEVDQRKAERVCIRAYHYIAGHLMAMHHEDYEKARVARVAHYQAHVALWAKKGTAPPGEDTRSPIQPHFPTSMTGGPVVSPVEMTGWAMCWHVAAVRARAIAATDTPMGVSSTDDVPQQVVVQRAAAKHRFEVIRRHVEYYISPIDLVVDVPTHAFMYDQRDRAEDLMGGVGWIQKLMIQWAADQQDTRRFLAAKLDPDVAGAPHRDLPEMLLWMHHFNRICGHDPDLGPKWIVELGLAPFSIGEMRFGITGALPAEAHETIAKLMLKEQLLSNGKGPNSPSPAFSMLEFMNGGAVVHMLMGSEFCIYEDGNRRYKRDLYMKTVHNFPDVCNGVGYPGRLRSRTRCRPGDGATAWLRELKQMLEREVKGGYATVHHGADGKVSYKFVQRSVLFISDAGNDMNLVARSDEIATWGKNKRWKSWRQVDRDEKSGEELTAHTSAVNGDFIELVDLAVASHEAIVYVHTIDPALFAEIGEAHVYMKEQRIKICRERHPGRVTVINGASLIKGLDGLASSIRDENEWHRSCEHGEWAQHVTTYINTTVRMALSDALPSSVREYVDSIMTEDIERKMVENAAKVLADVAVQCSIPVPDCEEDLLGGDVDNALNSSPPSTLSGIREKDEGLAPTKEHVLFQIETGGQGPLSVLGADIGAQNATVNLPSAPRLAANLTRLDPKEFDSRVVMRLLAVSLWRCTGSDLRNKAENDGTYYWWTIEVMRMIVTVPYFNAVDRAAFYGLGATMEDLEKLTTFSGGTYIFESCAKNMPVAEIRYAATSRTVVGTTVAFMARTVAGPNADEYHYVAFGVPTNESFTGLSYGTWLRDTPGGVAELRRQYGERMEEALKDCQGLPSAALDAWDLAGDVVGADFKANECEMYRQQGMHIVMSGKVCKGVRVPQDGPIRLHEIVINQKRGMKQPAQVVVSRRVRRIFARTLLGSVEDQAHRLPANDRMVTSLAAVRMAEDIGVFEPFDLLRNLSPGSLVIDRVMRKRFYLCGPFLNSHSVEEAMDENFRIAKWVGVEVQRDAQGWDTIDLHDNEKLVLLDASTLRANFTGYHFAKIVEAAEDTPYFLEHAKDYRRALLKARVTVGYCETETMQVRYGKAHAARAFAANRVPYSVTYKRKMARLRGDPSPGETGGLELGDYLEKTAPKGIKEPQAWNPKGTVVTVNHTLLRKAALQLGAVSAAMVERVHPWEMDETRKRWGLVGGTELESMIIGHLQFGSLFQPEVEKWIKLMLFHCFSRAHGNQVTQVKCLDYPDQEPGEMSLEIDESEQANLAASGLDEPAEAERTLLVDAPLIPADDFNDDDSDDDLETLKKPKLVPSTPAAADTVIGVGSVGEAVSNLSSMIVSSVGDAVSSVTSMLREFKLEDSIVKASSLASPAEDESTSANKRKFSERKDDASAQSGVTDDVEEPASKQIKEPTPNIALSGSQKGGGVIPLEHTRRPRRFCLVPELPDMTRDVLSMMLEPGRDDDDSGNPGMALDEGHSFPSALPLLAEQAEEKAESEGTVEAGSQSGEDAEWISICEEFRPVFDDAPQESQIANQVGAPPSASQKGVRPTAGSKWAHSLRPDLATVAEDQPEGSTPPGFFASNALESGSELFEPLGGEEPEPEDENLDVTAGSSEAASGQKGVMRTQAQVDEKVAYLEFIGGKAALNEADHEKATFEMQATRRMEESLRAESFRTCGSASLSKSEEDAGYERTNALFEESAGAVKTIDEITRMGGEDLVNWWLLAMETGSRATSDCLRFAWHNGRNKDAVPMLTGLVESELSRESVVESIAAQRRADSSLEVFHFATFDMIVEARDLAIEAAFIGLDREHKIGATTSADSAAGAASIPECSPVDLEDDNNDLVQTDLQRAAGAAIIGGVSAPSDPIAVALTKAQALGIPALRGILKETQKTTDITSEASSPLRASLPALVDASDKVDAPDGPPAPATPGAGQSQEASPELLDDSTGKDSDTVIKVEASPEKRQRLAATVIRGVPTREPPKPAVYVPKLDLNPGVKRSGLDQMFARMLAQRVRIKDEKKWFDLMAIFNDLPDLKKYAVLKMSASELMVALNEITPSIFQGEIFGPRPEDAGEAFTPRPTASAVKADPEATKEELPNIPEGIIFDIMPLIALVTTEDAKRRIYEIALERRVTVVNPVPWKRVMKAFLDMDFSVKQYLLSDNVTDLGHWLINTCEVDDRDSFTMIQLKPRKADEFLVPSSKRKPGPDAPARPALPLLAEQGSGSSAGASSSAAPPDNFMCDNKARLLFENYRKGANEGFVAGGRLGKRQLVDYFRAKFGRKDVLDEVIYKNIRVPASFARKNLLLGRNTPKQFKGYQYDKRSGLLWKDVYDLGVVESEAAKVPPATFTTLNDRDEARRFKRKSSRFVGQLDDIFTDTVYGKRVVSGKGQFVIPSGHDFFRFTYGTWENVGEYGGTRLHIGKIVHASPKPANKSHVFESSIDRDRKLQQSQEFGKNKMGIHKNVHFQKGGRIKAADKAITVALRYQRSRLDYGKFCGNWVPIEGDRNLCESVNVNMKNLEHLTGDSIVSAIVNSECQLSGDDGGKVRFEMLAYHDFKDDTIRVVAIRIKSGTGDTMDDLRATGKVCNQIIRDATHGYLFHQTLIKNVTGIMEHGLLPGGPTGKRKVVMWALMHSSDDQIEHNDMNTQAGQDRANVIASKANRFIDKTARTGKEDYQSLGSALPFQQFLKNEGIVGHGTGQHLGKGENLEITSIWDWNSIDASLRDCVRLEQNENSLQVGSVSSELPVPPCHLVEMMCIWKGSSKWTSLLLFHADLKKEKPAGMLKITDFARRYGGQSKWRDFLQTWRWFMDSYRSTPDIGIIDRIRHQGQEGYLEWRACEIVGCRGAIAAGGAMCLTCGGLCLFYSEEDGSPYAPSCTEITADLTGIPDCATTIGGAVTKEAAEKVPMTVKAAVATLANVKVQIKQSTVAKGKQCIKILHENCFLHCSQIAAEGDVEAFLTKFVARDRHPYATGALANGETYRQWIRDTYTPRSFAAAAEAAAASNVPFIPAPPRDLKNLWRSPGFLTAMVDKATGQAHDLYFNELCEHMATVLEKLHTDKGSQTTFLKGDLSAEQSEWVVKNFFRVNSGNINDLSERTSDVYHLLQDLDSQQTVLTAKNRKHKVTVGKLDDIASTADSGPAYPATPSINPRAKRAEKVAEAGVPAATDTVIGVGSERVAIQPSGAWGRRPESRTRMRNEFQENFVAHERIKKEAASSREVKWVPSIPQGGKPVVQAAGQDRVPDTAHHRWCAANPPSRGAPARVPLMQVTTKQVVTVERLFAAAAGLGQVVPDVPMQDTSQDTAAMSSDAKAPDVDLSSVPLHPVSAAKVPLKKFKESLANKQPAEQKQLIGDRLFARVMQFQPEIACAITGLMLEQDNSVLLDLLEPDSQLEEVVGQLTIDSFRGAISQEPFLPTVRGLKLHGSVTLLIPEGSVRVEAVADWSHMYNSRRPWLVTGITEEEFERMVNRDRLNHLTPRIANALAKLGYSDANTNQYYLNIVCNVLPMESREGEPKASIALQVRRALVFINHPDVLHFSIGEIDAVEAEQDAAGGLPSFLNAQIYRAMDEMIEETPQLAARSSEDYSRVLRPGRNDIELVISGAGSESQRLAIEQFTNDSDAVTEWGANIGNTGLLRTHRVVVEALRNRIGEGPADGLTRVLIYFAACIAEILNREAIDDQAFPHYFEDDVWCKTYHESCFKDVVISQGAVTTSVRAAHFLGESLSTGEPIDVNVVREMMVPIVGEAEEFRRDNDPVIPLRRTTAAIAAVVASGNASVILGNERPLVPWSSDEPGEEDVALEEETEWPQEGQYGRGRPADAQWREANRWRSESHDKGGRKGKGKHSSQRARNEFQPRGRGSGRWQGSSSSSSWGASWSTGAAAFASNWWESQGSQGGEIIAVPAPPQSESSLKWMALAIVLMTIMIFCVMEMRSRYGSERHRSKGWRLSIVEIVARVLGVYSSVLIIDSSVIHVGPPVGIADEVEGDDTVALPLLEEQSSLPEAKALPAPSVRRVEYQSEFMRGVYPWLPEGWGVDCAAVFVADGDNRNSFHLTRGCPHLQSVPVSRIVGLVVDKELVYYLRSCQTCVKRLQKGKLQLKYVKPACFETTDPNPDGSSLVSYHMAVGYIPTRYPANVEDQANTDQASMPAQITDVAERSTSFISGPAAPLSEQRAHSAPKTVPLRNALHHIGLYRLGDTLHWHRVQVDMETAMNFPLPLCIGNTMEVNMQRIIMYLRSFPSVRGNVFMDSEWYGEDIRGLTDGWVRDGTDAAKEGLMIEAWLEELRGILCRVHYHNNRPEPDHRNVFTRAPVGSLGAFRLHDRDYWVDVAETLDEAQDLDIPHDVAHLYEDEIHNALNYLHSFPSLRCHLTLREEWHGEETYALTDQWGRDGIDAHLEGQLIDFWLNKLRELIRDVPR